jgi:hypothetical protein
MMQRRRKCANISHTRSLVFNFGMFATTIQASTIVLLLMRLVDEWIDG